MLLIDELLVKNSYFSRAEISIKMRNYFEILQKSPSAEGFISKALDSGGWVQIRP